MAPLNFEEIRIENTNACGYRCVMCPREKLDRPLGYMTRDDFSLILDRLGSFEGRVHLHGFGEPLLDRSLLEKIRLLKRCWPKSSSYIFSTLGVKNIDWEELAISGLDYLNVSMYGFARQTYKNVHGVDRFDLVRDNLEQLAEAIAQKGSFLKVYVKIPSLEVSSTLPIAFPHQAKSLVQWIEELGFTIAIWPKVHNYGDGRQFNMAQTERLCPVIEGSRSNILNITWDLNVIPCGLDYNATIRFGSLKKQSLEEIFSSPEYLRFVLSHKSNALSDYPVCMGCDKMDY